MVVATASHLFDSVKISQNFKPQQRSQLNGHDQGAILTFS